MNLSPNDSNFQFYNHIRLGPQCRRITYPSKSASTKTLRFNSFSCIGPRLFNITPRYIKESANLNICKGRLDKLLQKLPDEPPTLGYRSSHSNSLLEMVRLIHQSCMEINGGGTGEDDGTAADSRSQSTNSSEKPNKRTKGQKVCMQGIHHVLITEQWTGLMV